jgi:hypothetical protein
MRSICECWESLGGYFEFGVGSVMLMSPLPERAGYGAWPCAIYDSGKVEIVFQHMANKPAFRDASVREELRRQLNEIPGVTQLPEGSLNLRPGFDMSELEPPGAAAGFRDVLRWFHMTTQEFEPETS